MEPTSYSVPSYVAPSSARGSCSASGLLLPELGGGVGGYVNKEPGSLVGKWQEIDGEEHFEFRSDGTFRGGLVTRPSESPKDVSGAYLVEGHLVGLKLQGHLPQTSRYKVSGRDLVISFERGGNLKYYGSFSKYRRLK